MAQSASYIDSVKSCSFKGHKVYGITDLTISAAGLQAIVEDCATAAKSHDARDKYFQSFAGEFGPCSSKALRSELPSLEVIFQSHGLMKSGGEEVHIFSQGGASICSIYCKRVG